MSFKPTSIPTKRLSQSILSTDSSFKLDNILGWDGNALTSSDFGSQAYCVFRNAARTQIEIIEFDPSTIASSSITIIRRGLQFDGDPTTEVSANKFDWTSGDTFVDLGTDTPQLWQWLKDYIDSIAIAGSPSASTTIKGISEEATDAEVLAKTTIGGTGARLFVNPGSITALINSLQPVIRTYNYADSPATWTKPTGLYSIKVQVWGGGGSGGRLISGSGAVGGGGGGAYAERIFLASELGATETITIGAGGTAKTTDGDGNAGGNTTFGSLLTGYGGGGGASHSAGAGGGGGGGLISAGGSATTNTAGSAGSPTGFSGAGGSDTSVNGNSAYLGAGGGGSATSGGSTGAGGDSYLGGAGGGGSNLNGASAGGSSVFGGSGGAGDSATSGNAVSGSVPGGGGGGKGNDTGTGNSGAGGNGKCVVTEYYI